jgi:hypothetical protein
MNSWRPACQAAMATTQTAVYVSATRGRHSIQRLAPARTSLQECALPVRGASLSSISRYIVLTENEELFFVQLAP